MSLPRRRRLSGQAAFSRVFEQAVVSADASFKVIARDSNQPESRLGMAVSRQVDKRAVARNRLKRIIRESFRSYFGSGVRRGGASGAGHRAMDVVVCPRPHAVSLENTLLFEHLSRHWRRIDPRPGQEIAGASDQACPSSR